MRIAMLLLYYGVLRHLPGSYLVGGAIWRYLRLGTCRQLFRKCGENVNIVRGAYFGSGEQLSVGNNSGLGTNCWIGRGSSIGANVMMGADVIVFTRNHETSRTDIPMLEQGYADYQPVVIEDDVWIGARVIILPGVHIGKGAVIGAGSVVPRDVPDYAVVAGNPARIVRMRNCSIDCTSVAETSATDKGAFTNEDCAGI